MDNNDKKVRGFIVHPSYRTKGNKSFVYLCGRLENGKAFIVINEYKPYFYIRRADLDFALRIKEFDYEEKDMKNFDGEPVLRVFTNIPKEVPQLRKALEGIQCYEADIRFEYRYMVDMDVRGIIEIEGNFENKGNTRIYREAKIKQADNYDVKLKLLSIDFETNRNATEIYSIALYSDDIKEVFIVDKGKLKHATSFPSEKELLSAFCKKVQELDPDVITGWNVIDFDLLLLEKQLRKYKIPFSLGRMGMACNLRISHDFFRESKASFPGRIVLDGIALLKNNFIKLDDYKLQTAASIMLGDEKLITDTGQEKYEEIERFFREEPQKLVDYTLKDAELVYRILTEKGIMDLTIERSILTGMQLDRVSASIASLDSLYLRETRKRKIVCPSIERADRGERIKGGYVMESKPGIYDYVIVFDFKSLYPSIIRTFNIDPISFNEKGTIVAPNRARFLNTDGILPMLIRRLGEQRNLAKKKKNITESNAIKITMNSFFGVLANPTCRFYSLEIANAITSFGRSILKNTMRLLNEKGYRVIYGDTDSIFIDTRLNNEQDASKMGKDVQDFVNRYYKEDVEKEYNRESFLEIEFDKIYKMFFMPMVRSADSGAKKRYAGLVVMDGKEKIDFTGLEFVRRDWTELSKRFQHDMLNMIFHKKDIKEYVRQFVSELREGKYDDFLIYRKALRKPLEEYTKTTPPHVKAAKMLNGVTSNIISYVMTENGPEPVEKVKNKIDYDHYIEKQLKPVADSILVFFDVKFEDIIKGGAEEYLFGFS